MKKVIVGILCLTMLFSLLACGGNSEKETTAAEAVKQTEAAGTAAQETAASEEQQEIVTLSFYLPKMTTYSDEAIAEVEEKVCEYTSEKYGWNVKLVYSDLGDQTNVVNLAMTTGDLDVCCHLTSVINMVANNQLLDITDRFAASSQAFQDTFTETELTSSSVNGRLYGVPRSYQFGGGEVAIFNKDMISQLGIDPLSVNSMDTLEELLYKAHEAFPDVYTFVPQTSSATATTCFWTKNVGRTTFAYAENMDSSEVSSIFELESFAEFCTYTSRWYNDGITMADALSNTQKGSAMVTEGAAFASMSNADVEPLSVYYSELLQSDWIIQPQAHPGDVGIIQYGIASTTAHPDEAFELLEAMYTDATLATLVAYGIEGVHYVIDDNGKAAYPEGMTAETEPYGGFVSTAIYPDYLILPVKASATIEDYYTTVTEWNKNVRVSVTDGFVYDTSDIQDFLTAYSNFESKYYSPVNIGAVALDDVLPAIQDELESIGFYEVLADMQEELDAWLAAK